MEQYRQEKNDDSDNSPNKIFQDNVEDDNNINEETGVTEESQQQQQQAEKKQNHYLTEKINILGNNLGFPIRIS
eukprot:7700728-Ditylum_brightwellii.AAC.1